MSRGMTTLAKAAENDAAAFEALGISQEEVASMNQEELFAATIKGLQGMEEGTERTALAAKLLGGSAKELGPLLNTSAEETEVMRKRVHELGGVLSDEAVKNSAAFEDSLQDLKTTISGAKNQLLSEFLPAATQVMDGLTAIFSGDRSGMDKIKQGITDFISTLSERLPEFVQAGVEIAQTLIEAIAENLPMLIQSLIDTVINLLPMLIEGAIQLVAGLVAALPEIIMGLIEAIPDILNAIVEGFAPIVGQLGEVFTQAWEFIKGIFAPVGEWFTARKEDVQNAFAAIDGWFNDKFTAAKDFVHSAWESIGSWFGDRWSDIQGAMQSADSWFNEKFTTAKENVHTAWSDIGSFFSQKWQDIKDVFSDAWNIFKDIGINIVKGLMAGIGQWISNAMEKARELIRRVKGAANDEAGVASPSKVFRKIGRFLDEGLMLGITDDADEPVNAMKRLMQNVTGVSGHVNASYSGAAVGTTGDAGQPIILQVLLDGKVIGETSYNYIRRRTRMVGA